MNRENQETLIRGVIFALGTVLGMYAASGEMPTKIPEPPPCEATHH